jgi:hypothetical protein
VDQERLREGEAEINVEYFVQDPATGDAVAFQCEGSDCSVECIPDQVRITVTGFEYRRMLDVLGLPPVALPDFRTALSMEGAGCNPEEGTCLP